MKTECLYNKTELSCLAVSAAVSAVQTSRWAVHVISSTIHHSLLRSDTARFCRFLPTFHAQFSPEDGSNMFLRNGSVVLLYFEVSKPQKVKF